MSAGAFLLSYPPGSNRLWRTVRGKVIVSAEALAWKREAAWRAQAAGIRPLAGAVAVILVLHPRMTAKGRANQTRLDVDAPIKVTLDALQGVAFGNDKQVTFVSSTLGPPLPGGGLSVSVHPASEIPCPTTHP